MSKRIKDISQLDLSRQYTYADYLTWQFKERVELLRGWLRKMSPAPKRIHQDVLLNLATLLKNRLRKHSCHLYIAPFDVRLEEGHTVVQPDLCIICDIEKLDERGCNGAPDLVAEVISPSSVGYDTVDKFQIYESAGVREYWIVDVGNKVVIHYFLEGGKYKRVETYHEDGVKKIPVLILEGEIVIEWDDIFDISNG